jgi:hypothetical protein
MQWVVCCIKRLPPYFPNDKTTIMVRSVFISMDRFMVDIVTVYCEHSQRCVQPGWATVSYWRKARVYENYIRRNCDKKYTVVKYFLCLIKTSVGLEAQLQAFLTTALAGGVVSIMMRSPSSQGKRLRYQWTEGWVSFSCSGRGGKEEAVFLTLNLVRSSVTIVTDYPGCIIW